MSKIIGAADEFWRLRITRVDASAGLDFEWHHDILYRQPAPAPVTEVETWYVEAVRLDDIDMVVRVASLQDREGAQSYLEQAMMDLSEMTKAQFEDAYLSVDIESPQPEDPDSGFDGTVPPRG